MADDEADRAHTARVLENERAQGTVADVSAAIAELDVELDKPTENPVGTPTMSLVLLVLCSALGPVFGFSREDSIVVGGLAAVAYIVAVHDTWTRVRKRRRRRAPELRERRKQLMSALGCGDPTCTRDPCREAFAAVANRRRASTP